MANMLLEPGTIYAHIDEAVHAATCLCALHPKGATVYGTANGVETARAGLDCFTSGEAYIVAIAAKNSKGETWAKPGAPYEPIYTITKPKGAR